MNDLIRSVFNVTQYFIVLFGNFFYERVTPVTKETILNIRISRCRCALCAALLVPSAAWASHPLITDDAGTVGQGHFQFEVSGQADHNKEGGKTTGGGLAAATLSYGITDTIDLVVGVPYLWTENDNGFSDTSVDVKFRVFEKDGLSFAIKPGLSLPTGDDDKGLGMGRLGGHLYLIGTKEIGAWSFNVNLGYIRNETSGDTDEKNIWHASVAAIYTLNDQWKIAADIVADRNTDNDGDNDPVSAIAGVIFSPTKDIDFDFGVKRGITSSAPDWSLMAGTTFKF